MRQIPSPNFSSRYGYRPEILVFHRMQGTAAGTDAWFQNPQAQVSAHYGMDDAGNMRQYVQDADAAWANGLPAPCTWIDQTLNPHPGVNPNYFTLSLEVSGWVTGTDPRGAPVTAAQLAACVAWAKEKCAQYGIPIDRAHLIGHGQIGGHPACPGADFPLDLIVAQALS